MKNASVAIAILILLVGCDQKPDCKGDVIQKGIEHCLNKKFDHLPADSIPSDIKDINCNDTKFREVLEHCAKAEPKKNTLTREKNPKVW